MKYGNNDIQFSGVSRGSLTGSGEHPGTVVWHKQWKIFGTANVMIAHNRISGQGQKFKNLWDKKHAARSKKAQKKLYIKMRPMHKQISDSMRK